MSPLPTSPFANSSESSGSPNSPSSATSTPSAPSADDALTFDVGLDLDLDSEEPAKQPAEPAQAPATPARQAPAAGGGLPTLPVAPKSIFGADGIIPTRPTLGTNGENARPAPDAMPKGGYQSVGKLTSHDLLENDFSRWEHLEDKIEELSDWIQETMTSTNQTEDVSIARQERGEKYEEMIKRLDRMILSKISNDRSITTTDKPYIVARVTNEILGLGPLEPLWKDRSITEIMADGPFKIRIERNGKIINVPGVRFRDADHLLHLCQQILAPLNRTLDVANPLEDGRLPDKSRVNAVHPAIAPAGPLLTIRRHREEAWTIKELVERQSMTEEIAMEIGYLVHSGCSTIVIGGTGTGKMLSHDTILPTPTGFTTMGDVKEGDYVLDETGNPTKVLAKYSLKDPVPYRVIFSDGTEVLADEDHNWFTSTRASRRSQALARKNEENRVRATRMEEAELAAIRIKADAALEDEYVSRRDVFDAFPHKVSMLSSFFANNAQAQELREETGNQAPGKDKYRYPAKRLWNVLHEHCSSYVRDQRHKMATESVVTTKEILATLKTVTGHTNHAVAVLESPVIYPKQDISDPYAVGQSLASGFEGNESARDEFTNKSGELHLPDAYRFSDVDQRKALLAGFLDVAGSVAPRSGMIRVSSKEVSLLRDISSVVASLGHKTTFTAPEKEGRAAKLSFRPNFNPFRNTEKAEAFESAFSQVPDNGGRDSWRYIVDVQPYEGKVEMSCITVDSPNSLYLCTDQYIATHNTTVLNAISGLIPENERVVTIEDNLELQLHPDRMVVSMEARPAGANQRGEVSIRDLVRNALRMRPDRIVVGEVRDAAAFDMLQAMNTGHDGSLTTYHANGAEESIPRLESLVQMAGELDPKGVKALIAGAVDVIVVVERYEDGSRRVSGVYEIPNRVTVDESGNHALHPIPLWEFVHDETTPEGKVVGHYERRNEISEGLIRKHRLNRRPRLSIEQIYELGKLHSDDDDKEEL